MHQLLHFSNKSSWTISIMYSLKTTYKIWIKMKNKHTCYTSAYQYSTTLFVPVGGAVA